MASDSTRELILDAAGPVFADKGFGATTVREICKAAAVNLAAVNYYFGDKHQLYVETVRRAYQLRSAQIPMPSWPANATSAMKLTGFIHTMIVRLVGLEKAPWPTRLLTREVLSPTAACKELVEEHFRPQFESLLSIIDEFVPASVSLSQRQKIAFSIFGQCLLYRVASEVVTMLVSDDDVEQYFDVHQIAAHIATFSLAALGVAPVWQVQTETVPSIAKPDGSTQKHSIQT